MKFHWQNLNKNRKNKKFIHARCWIGKDWGIELASPGDLIAKVSLCSDGDNAFVVSIGVLLFTIFITNENSRIYKLLEPMTKRKDQKYTNGRVIGFSFHSKHLWIKLWEDPMESRSSDPWWWAFSFDFPRIVFGKMQHGKVVLDSGETSIDMPEGAYHAEYQVIKRTWKRPRWFEKERKIIEFDIKNGIPFWGKGENSWDMGLTAYTNMSVMWNGGFIHEATKEIALRCMRQRSETGSLNDSSYAGWHAEKHK